MPSATFMPSARRHCERQQVLLQPHVPHRALVSGRVTRLARRLNAGLHVPRVDHGTLRARHTGRRPSRSASGHNSASQTPHTQRRDARTSRTRHEAAHSRPLGAMFATRRAPGTDVADRQDTRAGAVSVGDAIRPMRKAKVLVVDDAMLIRRIVTDVLAADPSIEVVGEAANGRIALQKIAQLSPDLVTLDIEMPEMDGIQTLKEIRKTYPRLSAIMFSALTERGAADTLEALHHGASDYVTKPASAAGRATAQQRIREDLVPKIKSLCRVAGARPAPPAFAPRPLGPG